MRLVFNTQYKILLMSPLVPLEHFMSHTAFMKLGKSALGYFCSTMRHAIMKLFYMDRLHTCAASRALVRRRSNLRLMVNPKQCETNAKTGIMMKRFKGKFMKQMMKK